MMERYGVFIDAGYFLYVLRNDFSGCKIDHLKLSEALARPNEERLRTYYYDCPPYVGNPPSAEEKRRKAKFDQFLSTLRKMPRFEVRLGRLKKINNNYEQKMVDVLMAIDLVKLSIQNNIQRAIIITNDTDFVPAIKIAKDSGVIVTLYRGKTDFNDELLETCDEYFAIDQPLIEKVRL